MQESTTKNTEKQARVSLYSRANSDKPKTTTPETVLAGIRSGQWRKVVEAVRAGKAKKNRLPAVTFGGEFRGGHKRQNLRELSGFGVLDVDDAEDAPALRDTLRADSAVCAAFISPGGEGVKVLVRVKANSPEEFTSAMIAAAEYFGITYGVKCDRTHDVTRLCFVSYDPETFIAEEFDNVEAFEPFSVSNPVSNDKEEPTNFDSLDHICDDFDIPADAEELLTYIKPDIKRDEWLDVANGLKCQFGDDAFELFVKWSAGELHGEEPENFVSEEDCRKVWKSVERNPTDRKPVTFRSVIRMAQLAGYTLPISKKKLLSYAKCGQRGDSKLLRELLVGRYLYDHTAKVWREFASGVWEARETNPVRRYAADLLTDRYFEAVKGYREELDEARKRGEDIKEREKTTVKALFEKIKLLNSRNHLNAVLDMAADGEPLGVTAKHFDADANLLNVRNGVIDLKTLSFREHRPDDLFLKQCNVEYKPRADCAKFKSFLTDVFKGDKEVIEYVKRLFGYCLTAETGLDLLTIAYGSGGNGKTVLFQTLEELFGGYFCNVETETLLQKKFTASSDEYKKAKLKGVRVAVGSEIPANRKLNASLVKDLTGGDTITARNPYERPFSFHPTHKIFLFGNHKPEVNGSDDAIWRRLRLIPFEHRFPQEGEPGHVPKERILADFRGEFSGILNWLLNGLKAYRKDGEKLRMPERVKAATESYRAENDTLRLFLQERCAIEPKAKTTFSEVFEAYEEFLAAEEIFEENLNKRRFSDEIKRLNFRIIHGAKRKTFILGLKLKNAETNIEEELL